MAIDAGRFVIKVATSWTIIEDWIAQRLQSWDVAELSGR
jgi:hypothetical protein